MELIEINKKLNIIMREVFDNDDIIITPEMVPSDIAQWDSLNNIRLIVAIESDFGISFNIDELANFDAIDKLIKIIKQKLE